MPWEVISAANSEPSKPAPQADAFFKRAYVFSKTHRDGFVVVGGIIIAAGILGFVAKFVTGVMPRPGFPSPMRATLSAPVSAPVPK